MRIWWEAADNDWTGAMSIMAAKASRLRLDDQAIEDTAELLWDAGPSARVTLAGDVGEAVWGGPVLYLADSFAVIPENGVADPLTIRGDPIWQSADIQVEPTADGRIRLVISTVSGVGETICSHADLVSAIHSFRSSIVSEMMRRNRALAVLLTFRPLAS